MSTVHPPTNSRSKSDIISMSASPKRNNNRIKEDLSVLMEDTDDQIERMLLSKERLHEEKEKISTEEKLHQDLQRQQHAEKISSMEKELKQLKNAEQVAQTERELTEAKRKKIEEVERYQREKQRKKEIGLEIIRKRFELEELCREVERKKIDLEESERRQSSRVADWHRSAILRQSLASEDRQDIHVFENKLMEEEASSNALIQAELVELEVRLATCRESWREEVDRLQQEQALCRIEDKNRRAELHEMREKLRAERLAYGNFGVPIIAPEADETEEQIQRSVEEVRETFAKEEAKHRLHEEELAQQRRKIEEAWQQEVNDFKTEKLQWEKEKELREDEARRQQEEESRRRVEFEDRIRRERAEQDRLNEERFKDEQRRRDEAQRRRAKEIFDEENETNQRDIPTLLIEEASSAALFSNRQRENLQEEKERLLLELQQAREERAEIEKRREDLVRRAKQLQAKTQNRRNQARDIWKKRYFEEKKKTPPMEEQANKMRAELENLHRKIVGTMETALREKKSSKLEDDKVSLRVQATRLQHEIEEYQRRVDEGKMKLTAEIKLRTQAEAELRALKADLTQKKINLTLTRSQQLATLGNSSYTPKTPILTPKA